MSLNIISFSRNLLRIFIDYYTFLFWLFSYDTLHVLMFVYPSNSELRFYGWYHTCLFIYLSIHQSIIYLSNCLSITKHDIQTKLTRMATSLSSEAQIQIRLNDVQIDVQLRMDNKVSYHINNYNRTYGQSNLYSRYLFCIFWS